MRWDVAQMGFVDDAKANWQASGLDRRTYDGPGSVVYSMHVCMAGVWWSAPAPNATVRETAVDGALTAASPTRPGQAHMGWGRCGTVVDMFCGQGMATPARLDCIWVEVYQMLYLLLPALPSRTY